ncbi:MAG: response regulator transcription factor [Chloroflexales bacterium]|jgi:two-component system, OmpR family, response regulator MprA
MASRILVVDDEVELTASLKRGLTLEGYTVDVANDGPAAISAMIGHAPDLVILDWMLPGLDGIEIARRLRATGTTPVIMLTARDTVDDRVAGLESGATDYLCKPFAFAELLARVRVQLRAHQSQGGNEVLRFGPITLDVCAHTVTVRAHNVSLTAKEFEILELMMRSPHQVITREVFYDRIWGYDFGGEGNVIEVYISALRQKLSVNGTPRLIQTVRGIGYVLREDV